MVYLHEDKHRVHSTIEGYRTSIGQTLKAHKNIDIGNNPHLSNLLSNFERDSEHSKSSVPQWDLSLVLQKLEQAPFEPMEEAEIKFTTFKTVFLVALATGKRRSELHAMKKDILHAEGWKAVSIVPDPQFIAKTQLNNKGSEMLKVAVIKALPSDSENQLNLCPVRALRHYIKQTAKIRNGRKKLFVAIKKGHKTEIHMNTISSWIKQTILLAYDTSTQVERKKMGVKAHQVRAMASSWALHCNASMDDIMASCSWKSRNTFTKFYLKDMEWQRDAMFHLGPVVVASHTSQESRR